MATRSVTTISQINPRRLELQSTDNQSCQFTLVNNTASTLEDVQVQILNPQLNPNNPEITITPSVQGLGNIDGFSSETFRLSFSSVSSNLYDSGLVRFRIEFNTLNEEDEVGNINVVSGS